MRNEIIYARVTKQNKLYIENLAYKTRQSEAKVLDDLLNEIRDKARTAARTATRTRRDTKK